MKDVLIRAVKTGYQSAFGAFVGLHIALTPAGIPLGDLRIAAITLGIAFLAGIVSVVNNAILAWARS